MWVEVGIIVAGIPLGYALHKKPLAVSITNHALSFVIYALLFLIGLNLGSNDSLISRLADLGIQGIFIGIISALGSILAVWFFYNIIFKAKL